MEYIMTGIRTLASEGTSQEGTLDAWKLFMATLDGIGDAVLVVDPQGNIKFANAAAKRLLQLSETDLTGKPFTMTVQILNEFGRNTHYDVIQCGLAGSPLYDRERQLLLRRGDGSTVPIEDYATTINMPDGSILGLLVVLKDVSERQQAQSVLDLSGKMFREFLDFTPDAVLLSSMDGLVIKANARAAQLFGYPLESMQGVILRNLVPHCLSCEKGQCTNSGCWTKSTMSEHREMQCYRADGTAFFGEISIGMLDSIQGALMLVLVRDITQRKQFEEKIAYQATHDILTGLPNRFALISRLDHMVKRASKHRTTLAVMYVDLHDFKNVNDLLGASLGDQVLCEIGKRLQQVAQDEGAIARSGSDEFVVAMHCANDKVAIDQIVATIVDKVNLPIEADSLCIRLSCNIGIATYPEDGDDATTLLRNADMAMYGAKDKGGNGVSVYQPEMRKTQQDRLDISNAMRTALAQDEFELFYQPKLDLHNWDISGMEALLRWNHPEKGSISPAFFIPLAEANGMIVEIGRWVINETCRQIAEWRAQGIPEVRVAINLSAGQCQRDDVHERLINAIHTHGITPDMIEVELTESMVLHDPEHALQIFRALRNEGVHIAIDDFGTGYSSFAYLKTFPSHKLKIDKCFVERIDTDPGDLEIVRAIIVVAHKLGLRVVAEGVETITHLDLLRRIGCDEIQGYYFCRPLPSKDIPGFILQRTRSEDDPMQDMQPLRASHCK